MPRYRDNIKMTDYRIGKGRAVWWFVNFKKICFLDTLYLDGATLLFCWLWYQCTWSIKLCLVVAWFSTSAPWSSSLSTTSVLITLVSFLERHRWSNLAPRRPLKDTLEEAFWPCFWALPSPHSASTFLAFYVLLRSTPPLCLMSLSTLHPFFPRAYSQFKAVVSTRFLYLYHSRWVYPLGRVRKCWCRIIAHSVDLVFRWGL